MSKKVEKVIKELMNVVDKSEKESIIVIHKNEKDDVHTYILAEDKLVFPSAIASLLDDYYGGGIKDGKDFAEGIVKAVCAVVENYGIAGRRIAMAIMPSLTTAAKNASANIRKHLSEIADLKDDDDDDTEDCENCDERYDCQLSDAIKWRKANGVPAPPRNRKARKGNRKNEPKGN